MQQVIYFIHPYNIQSNNKEFENTMCTSISILRAFNYLCPQLIITFLAQMAKFKETVYDKGPSSPTTT